MPVDVWTPNDPNIPPPPGWVPPTVPVRPSTTKPPPQMAPPAPLEMPRADIPPAPPVQAPLQPEPTVQPLQALPQPAPQPQPQPQQPKPNQFRFEGKTYHFAPDWSPEQKAYWVTKHVLADRRQLEPEQISGRSQGYDSPKEIKQRKSMPMSEQGRAEWAELLSGEDEDGNPVVIKPEDITPRGLTELVKKRKADAAKAEKEGVQPFALIQFNDITAAMERDLKRPWPDETTLEAKRRKAVARGADPNLETPTASASGRDKAIEAERQRRLEASPEYVARKDQPREAHWAETMLREYHQQYGGEVPRDKRALFDKANESYEAWLKTNPAGADEEFDTWRRSNPIRDLLHPEETKQREGPRQYWSGLSEAMVARHGVNKKGLGWLPYTLKRLPFAGSAAEATELLQMRRAVKNVEAGKGTDSDWFTIASAIDAAEKSEDASFGKKVWDVASHLPAYGMEFAMTGGAFAAGRAAARKGLVKVSSRALLPRMAKKAAGFLAGTAARTALNVPFAARQVARKWQPEFGLIQDDTGKLGIEMERDPSFMEALAKGYGAAYTEMGTEQAAFGLAKWPGMFARTKAGRALAKMPAVTKTVALKTALVNRFMTKGGTLAQAKEILNRAGYNGLLVEVFEEREVDVIGGALGIEKDYGTTGKVLAGDPEGWEQLAVEALAFAVIPAGMAALGATEAAMKPRDTRDIERLQGLEGKLAAGGTVSRGDAAAWNRVYGWELPSEQAERTELAQAIIEAQRDITAAQEAEDALQQPEAETAPSEEEVPTKPPGETAPTEVPVKPQKRGGPMDEGAKIPKPPPVPVKEAAPGPPTTPAEAQQPQKAVEPPEVTKQPPAAAQKPETVSRSRGKRQAPPVAPVEPQEAEPEAVGETPATERMVAGNIVQVPTEEINLDPDRFQFKTGVSRKTGTVAGEELQGEWDPLAGGVILLWEDESGKRWAVNGHHRVDLANRRNVPSLTARIVREVDGVTEEEARAMGAKLNILEGQGKVDDYADFFRATQISEEDAARQGLLARVKGKTGFMVGRFASEDVWAGYRAGKLSAEKAAIIADVGRNDDGLQAVGLQASQGKSAEELRHFLMALNRHGAAPQERQGDLFGFDDSAIREAEQISRAVTGITSALKDRLLAVQGALRRPETAKKMGLSGDYESIQQEVDRVREELARWEKWTTDPALVREARIKAGLEKPQTVEQVPGGVAGLTGQKDIFGGEVSAEQAASEKATVRERAAQEKKEAAKEGTSKGKKKPGPDFDQGKLFQTEEQGGLFDKIAQPVPPAAEAAPEVAPDLDAAVKEAVEKQTRRQRTKKTLDEKLKKLGDSLGETFSMGPNANQIQAAVEFTIAAADHGISVFGEFVQNLAERIGRAKVLQHAELFEKAWAHTRAQAGYEHLDEAGKVADFLKEPAETPPPPQGQPGGPTTGTKNVKTDKLIDDWLADRQDSEQDADSRAARHQDELRQIIGKRSAREAVGEAFKGTPRQRERAADAAMHVYIDLKDAEQQGFGTPAEQMAKYGDKLSDIQKNLFASSQSLPPAVQALADKIIEENKAQGEEALDAEVLKNVRDNYSARLWKQEPGEVPAAAVGKFRTTTSRAKARTLESILHGWSLGKELQITGAIGAQQIASRQVSQAIHDRRMIQAAVSEGLLSNKKEESDWQIVEHPNFKNWQWIGKAEEGEVYGRGTFITEDGDILQEQPLYAPAYAAKALNNILGTSKLPGSGKVTKWNAILKQLSLSLSLFHHQAFLRSYVFGTHGIEGFRPLKAYKEGRRAILDYEGMTRELVRGGLTIGKVQDFDELLVKEKTAIGKVIDKVPVAAEMKNALLALRDQQIDFLFRKLGANLKVMGALHEFQRLLTLNEKDLVSGKVTREELARISAEMLNDDFGGLNLQRMRRNPTGQHIFRLLALAPDWTESNVRSMVKQAKAGQEGAAYRRMWSRILLRAGGATVLFQLLMALMDDEEDFWSIYKRQWEEGNLRWLDVDITPLARAARFKIERRERKYFSVLGHFRDPIKFVTHPVTSAKHKSSVLGSFVLEALTGTDWAGRGYTTASELLGIDDKGTYKTSGKRSDGTTYEEGDPKGGQLAGQTVSWGNRGALEYSQLPSFMLAQGKGVLPIQIQNLIGFLAGEMDGFDALTKSMGLMTATTYPDKEKESEYGSREMWRSGNAEERSEQFESDLERMSWRGEPLGYRESLTPEQGKRVKQRIEKKKGSLVYDATEEKPIRAKEKSDKAYEQATKNWEKTQEEFREMAKEVPYEKAVDLLEWDYAYQAGIRDENSAVEKALKRGETPSQKTGTKARVYTMVGGEKKRVLKEAADILPDDVPLGHQKAPSYKTKLAALDELYGKPEGTWKEFVRKKTGGG